MIGKEPNPFLATVGLRVEPAPIGSGVRFRLAGEVLGTMPLAFFKAVEETVPETLRQGLYGWQVTDCVVTMTHTGYWPRQSHAHQGFNKSMSSTAGDFRLLTPLVLMDALRQAGTTVYEPIHRFHLEIPADTFGAMMPVLARLRAVPQHAGDAWLGVHAGGGDSGGAGPRAAAAAAGADARRGRAGMRLRLLPAGQRHDPDPATDGPQPTEPQGVPAARAASGVAALNHVGTRRVRSEAQ